MNSIQHTQPQALDATQILQREADLHEAVALALESARKQGADQVEAAASLDAGLSLTCRLGEVESLEHHRDMGLGITVYFQGRKGNASTADLSARAIRECVQKACDIARLTEADPCNGLPEAEWLADTPRELDSWHPLNASMEQLIERTLACEQAGLAADPAIRNSEGASFSSHQGISVLGNSLGFTGTSRGSRHSLSCVLIAEDDHGGMQRDYWYDTSRNADMLEAAEAIGRRAAERTTRRLGARTLATCQAPVLFTPEMTRGLLRQLVGALSGGNLYRKTSFLCDSLGQPLFPNFVQIHEQPFLPGALGSGWFDNEGVATRERAIIDQGQVAGYVLSSYSARKLGMESTGNAGGTHNLTLDPGEASPEALLQQMGTGLLLTETIGHGINLITGDYSQGAAGFWVENGQIAYPVEEITIAGNLREMFASVQAIGNDVDARASTRCPSLLLGPMTIAGQG